MLTLKLKQQIKDHCQLFPNNEVYGFIVLTPENKLIVFNKTKPGFKDSFFINPIDYISAADLGKIIAIYHSHINDNIYFSETDKYYSEKHRLTYILYNINKDKFDEYFPCGYQNKYLGLNFIYGQSDCFTLVRNYYRNELKYPIIDYPHNENWYKENKNRMENGILDHTKKEIFKETKTPKLHDILVFKYERIDAPHHLGIYVGNNSFLHHPRNKKSTIEIYDSSWISRTYKILHLNYARPS